MTTANFPKIPFYFWVILSLSLLVAFGLGFGTLFPKSQQLQTMKNMIQKRQQKIEVEQEYFLNIRQIKDKLAEYPEALAKIGSALPFGHSVPSLLNFLQKASSQSGLILKEISPFTISPAGEATSVKATQLSFTVVGSYNSFKSFITTLEKSARLIEIESISFSSPKEGDLFTFSLRITTHSY
jgi:Tfp pilus assembly protein PilO